ncbi:MAG: type IX secretion system membrane protein PorP/SprF [Flavobacteriales bacterium]
MKNLRLQLALAAWAAALAASAQQEVMVSQYMFNGLFLNPAYAGSHGYASSSLLHRQQWLQVEGAPRTSMLAIDAPAWGDRMGLGFSLVHDQIGISRDIDFSGHYAYRMRVGKRSRLALGLRAGLSVYSARISELRYWDANDPLYQQDIVNQPVGKFGFGLYWHDARSYVGISVPTIYAADGRITMDAPDALRHYFTQHYYVHAGRVFLLGEDFDIKPSTMIKYTKNAPIEADVNCNVLYRERIWAGIGYRTGDALVAMLEYQVTPQLRVGYAYDMTMSKLRTYTTGSHEVMLGIDFGRDLVRIKTPRYF